MIDALRTILLLLLLGTALTCVAQAAPASPPAEPVATTELEVEEATVRGELPTAFGAALGDLDEIRKRGVLRALVVPGRIGYFVQEGHQYGVTYELLVALEKQLNAGRKKGQRALRAAIVPTSAGRLIDDLRAGRGDVAAHAMSVIPEGARLMDYTAKLGTSRGRLAVTNAAEPALASLEALAGREVWLRRKSAALVQVDALNKRFKKEGREPLVIRRMPTEVTDEDLLEMVDAGIAPMTFVHEHLATTYGQVLKRIEAHPATALVEGEDLAWGVRKGSPKLKAAIDKFWKSHRAGTTMGNVLINRYLKGAKGLHDPRAAAERKKYEQMVQLFRKRADQYHMDHLLMIAQGFQESQLGQKVRSPVGAIGVMQLMPATGKEMKVGDVTKLEPNIHAGVKYMRWLIDEHFDDPKIDRTNKVLLGFAAYNAGPGRIQQMRRETKRRGLDPNRWFGNVELVTAQKVGREPVDYVANIYKYYLAYTLLAEEQARKSAFDPEAD
jgi:membrane-bound lytic murein transglycosylase MltF